MNREDSLPPLAELFLHVVLFVLPRDTFEHDRPALLRLARVRKNLVEQMHQCSGAFTLDLNLSAKNIVMMSPYPRCHLAYFEQSHFEALKKTAARFRSIDGLCVDLKQLPAGCNFINTAQILDLVFHCLKVGRARQLCISNAIFEADQFTDGLRGLPAHTRNQIVCIHLSHCGLTVGARLLRELAGMRNLRKLTLDGNKFSLADSGAPTFSGALEYLSVAGCDGVRPFFLKCVKKTLRALIWNKNAILDADKSFFLAWLAGSDLRALDMDNCDFGMQDFEHFKAAFTRMTSLQSLSVAGNDFFQDNVFWWIYEYWRQGYIPAFFAVHISNMHICFPDSGMPVFMSRTRFGFIEVHGY